jgi:protein-tyrosine kinase
VSRIEQALEKAMEQREAINPPGAQTLKAMPVETPSVLPEFQVRESVIDPARVDRHIVCITDPQSPGTEQYRKLRARILASTRPGFQNTIMVASADIGEGKTTTSINFAVALALEIDHTVLLVDADLRKPSVHTFLGLPGEVGLSEYLAGKVELHDVLINTGIGKLVILPAGIPPENPAELLSSKRMKDLVQEMKHRYSDRYIIFDSAPVLACADAISLSNHVDGIILVVQAARTSEKAVKKAVSLLKGAPILGVVYNNVPDYLGKNLYPYNYYIYQQGAEAAKASGRSAGE